MAERNCNALLAIILSSVLWGAFAIQFFLHETPCSLCLLQRMGMLSVAFGALLNVRFGIRKTHYAISLLSSVFGGFVALRQIALHVCPEFPPFGKPFWGLSLYTWSFIVFASCVTYIAVMMLIFVHKEEKSSYMNLWGKLAFLLTFSVAFLNIITTFILCGLSDCGWI